jgi:5-hydroxyisourate hydrolase
LTPALLLLATRSNRDGRCDGPLLQGDTLKQGEYELIYGIANYFRAMGTALTDPPLIDKVVIRFGIADAGADYHAPLLASPWSYSTYRGS